MAFLNEVLCWELERYGKLEGDSWITISSEKKKLQLYIKGLRILSVTHDGVALEVVPLSSRTIQATASSSSVMFMVAAQDETTVRKFKVQFRSKELCSDCKQILGQLIPLKDPSGVVSSQNAMQMANMNSLSSGQMDSLSSGQEPSEGSFVSVEQLALQYLQKNEGKNLQDLAQPLPTDFPLEAAIRSCLMDPTFPAMVRQVENVLKNIAGDGDKEEKV